jgi:hypothetical protein
MLSFLRRLTDRTPRRELVLEVPTLGVLRYDYEQNAWVGNLDEKNFGLSSRTKDPPTPMLVSYAVGALKAPGWLSTETDIARRAAIDEYPKEAATEISQLTIGSILFYQRKATCHLIADLDGGREFRSWRIEFRDRDCEGIGFDS